MTSSTLAIQPPAPAAGSSAVFSRIRRNSLMVMAGIGLTVLYLLYTFISFDIWELISRSQPQRAVLLATDAVAHKVHVTKTIRGAGGLSIAVEGERTATYENPPGWVTVADDLTRVDLARGYQVDIYDTHVVFQIPDIGPVHVRITDAGIETTLPRGVDPPDWLRATPAKFDARPTFGRRSRCPKHGSRCTGILWAGKIFSFLSDRNLPCIPRVSCFRWHYLTSGSILTCPTGA